MGSPKEPLWLELGWVLPRALVHGVETMSCDHDQPHLLCDIEASGFAWLCGLVWDQHKSSWIESHGLLHNGSQYVLHVEIIIRFG
jgi:hypothetical protein